MSRRNSFIKMTGVDVESSSKEESHLEATKVASDMLDAPSPAMKRKSSTKRRKSVLLGLDLDDNGEEQEPSIAMALSARRGSVRRKSLFADDDDDGVSPNLSR